MATIDTAPVPAATPNPGPSPWRDALAQVRATVDRLGTTTNRLSHNVKPAVHEQLDRLDTYCTLRPLHRAIARAHFQVRAYAFDREHRSTRLLAWAAALDALAHTLPTVSSPASPGTDSKLIEQVTNQATLLRAIAETERVRHATSVDPTSGQRRAPATPEIETAAADQLDRLCQPSLATADRITLLTRLATQLFPILGDTVQILRDLT